jgi:hypothetical protein
MQYNHPIIPISSLIYPRLSPKPCTLIYTGWGLNAIQSSNYTNFISIVCREYFGQFPLYHWKLIQPLVCHWNLLAPLCITAWTWQRWLPRHVVLLRGWHVGTRLFRGWGTHLASHAHRGPAQRECSLHQCFLVLIDKGLGRLGEGRGVRWWLFDGDSQSSTYLPMTMGCSVEKNGVERSMGRCRRAVVGVW